MNNLNMHIYVKIAWIYINKVHGYLAGQQMSGPDSSNG